ncbi:hypothetical protein BDY24DRAFT_436200 [Mrakia frigida]|uniref:uncharacterized protein n=1 Tax=Mrakia frigida TaxID=29902 RepID=UPI003FCC1310
MSSSSSFFFHPTSAASASLAGNLRGYETQASVLEAFSGRTSWTPSQIKAILLCYCEIKLASSGGAGRVHLSEKLALIEDQLKRNVVWKGEPLLPGLEAVFIEVRWELGLRPSPVFRSHPPQHPQVLASSYRAPSVVREASYSEGVGGGGGGLAPPAWTPRADDVASTSNPPPSNDEADLARAMRESLVVSSASSTAPLEGANGETPALPSSSNPPPRPTFQSTYLSLPLPTLSSPKPTFNDPLNILASSSYQILFLVDDSPSLDWTAAQDAVERLVPLVSLLQRDSGSPSSSDLVFIVVTDGSSPDDLESILVAAAKRLERLNSPQGHLGVFFLQLGNDLLARYYFRSLSKLSTKHPSLGREITDTTAWKSLPSSSTWSGDPRAGLVDEGRGEGEAVLLRKILLGSINRRVAEEDLDSSLTVDAR